ncbi:hypothetical protein TNCV_1785291 [Trichonephila clavipes]|nr:hypothetical protein TNCV_1785291 [Trichonephila clavipes]
MNESTFLTWAFLTGGSGYLETIGGLESTGSFKGDSGTLDSSMGYFIGDSGSKSFKGHSGTVDSSMGSNES